MSASSCTGWPSAAALRDRLASEPAQEVPELLPGDPDARETGLRVAGLLSKRRQDLTGADLELMRQVVGFVAAHRDEGAGPLGDDRWRRELMMVGHDPLKAR